MSAARIEKLENLLARVQRNRHAPPSEPRRMPSTPLELAVESAELPLPSEPPPPPVFEERGTPPAGVKVTPSFAKVAIPDDDEPELVMSEPSGDYDVVIDENDDDGDDLPTVPPPPPETPAPAVVVSSPGFEPVHLPPLPPSERPAVMAPAEMAPATSVEVEPPPPVVEAPRPPPVARPIEASASVASGSVARVVAPAPMPEPASFGELLERTLALRPR